MTKREFPVQILHVVFSAPRTGPGEREGTVGMTIWVWIPDTRRVSDLMGTSMEMIFYP
jgi:hypothetical protein